MVYQKVAFESFTPDAIFPELVFVCFQMTFACITAALVLGGVAERVKFAGVVIFAFLWPLLSYYPIAHMVWWWSGATSAATSSASPSPRRSPPTLPA